MNIMFTVLLIIVGVTSFAGWLYLYVVYRTMIFQKLVLYSAGRMKTGNDFGEQMKKTIKERKYPGFLEFYWRIINGRR